MLKRTVGRRFPSESIYCRRIIDYSISMASEKKSEKEARLRKSIEESKDSSLSLDIMTIKSLPSGSCYIPMENIGREKVVVCKEGGKIKIFRIDEEKKKQ